MNLYCIYDKLSESSSPLFEAKNDAVARRMWFNSVRNEVQMHDFELVRLGVFHNEDGKLYLEVNKPERVDVSMIKESANERS